MKKCCIIDKNLALSFTKGRFILFTYKSKSVNDTEAFAEEIAKKTYGGTVIALFGGLGMGKTAFTRGFVRGRGIDAEVSSPTFSLVHEYKGSPSVCHFDMYRISSWDDLYSTGFFDYLDMGGILVTEWSENIENALPENTLKICFEQGENENERTITLTGEGIYENFSC